MEPRSLSQYSDYGIGYTILGSNPYEEMAFYSSTESPDRLWGPPSHFGGKAIWNVGLTAHLKLIPKLRMRGYIPPLLPHAFVAYRGTTSCLTTHNIQGFVSGNNRKPKVIPLQFWTGPEVSRKLRLPDFKTVGVCRW